MTEMCRRSDRLRKFVQDRRRDRESERQVTEIKLFGTDYIPTIAGEDDIKRNDREQIQRFLDYRAQGFLPAPWRKFGEKHADEIAQFVMKNSGFDNNGRNGLVNHKIRTITVSWQDLPEVAQSKIR